MDGTVGKDLPLEDWATNYENPPPFLTEEVRFEWIKTLDGVALGSDAFVPFRDNVNRAKQVCGRKHNDYK